MIHVVSTQKEGEKDAAVLSKVHHGDKQKRRGDKHTHTQTPKIRSDQHIQISNFRFKSREKRTRGSERCEKDRTAKINRGRVASCKVVGPNQDQTTLFLAFSRTHVKKMVAVLAPLISLCVCVKIEFLNFEILHTSKFGFLFVVVRVIFFVWMMEAWTLETAATLFLPPLRINDVSSSWKMDV
jgi:uncharacterized membrane protein YdbT with pleckstrin-like domain